MGLGIRTALERSICSVRIGLLDVEGVCGFAGELVAKIVAKRNAVLTAPMIDSWRFPEWNNNHYDVRTTLAVLHFVIRNARKINRFAARLGDDESRTLLRNVLVFWAVGPHRSEPPIEASKFEVFYRRASELKRGDSELRLDPYDVARYEVDFLGDIIFIESWLGSLVSTFFERQYFLERDGLIIAPRSGDIVIDAGACFGDTALAFAAAVGHNGVVHSFEPLPTQRTIYSRNRAANPNLSKRMHLHNLALAAETGHNLSFTDAGAGSRPIDGIGTIEVETITLDDFLRTRSINRVDFIKMDIEGGECSALRGAANTIRTFQPDLAISAYHSLADLVGLGALIDEISPVYRYYLGHHSIHSEETVLYATVRAQLPHVK